MNYELREIPVDKIKPDKDQPRKTFDEESLKGLAESILSNGLLNPIEVDSDLVITDGERRWRAHKIANIKTITARIVPNKDKTEKLRRQLIFTLQDEETPTEDKYSAIVKLWEEDKAGGPPVKEKWCAQLGIQVRTLDMAMKYCNFVEEEPEIAKSVAPHIIVETASLPKEERKEVLKEFEGTKDKKKDLIRELVREKKQKIQVQKQLEEIKKKDINVGARIKTTEQSLDNIKKQINDEIHRIGKLMAIIGQVRRTKLYLRNPKYKESFFKFLDGSIDRVERWVHDLKNLKTNLEFEIIKE